MDRLLANFEQIVFHDEYDTTRSLDRVRKWETTLRILVTGLLVEQYRPIVERHAAVLSRLTGLDIELVDSSGAAHNVEVHIVPWDEMEAVAASMAPNPDWLATIIEESSCLFVFQRDAQFRIIRAMVAVSSDESLTANESCLLEELSQALGLPNDSELITPSIFNQWDRLTRLPVNDRILIRTLYDRRITPGMHRSHALRVAREVIEELSRPGSTPP